MLADAWYEGKQMHDNGVATQQTTIKTAKEMLPEKLKLFAEDKVKKYVDERGIGSIRSYIVDMGKRNTHNYNLHIYRNIEQRGYSIKMELADFDRDFFSRFNWDDILECMSNKISVSLEELFGDRQYKNLYIDFYKTQLYISGDNASLMFFAMIGLYGKWVDAIKMDLVIRKPPACVIMLYNYYNIYLKNIVISFLYLQNEPLIIKFELRLTT